MGTIHLHKGYKLGLQARATGLCYWLVLGLNLTKYIVNRVGYRAKCCLKCMRMALCAFYTMKLQILDVPSRFLL